MEATDRLLSEAETDPKIRRLCSDILGLVLHENHFMFQDTFYIQRQRTAMGSNVAPPYAVAYMAALEGYVFNHPLFRQYSRTWQRFIDDTFCGWDRPLETLLLFDTYINNIWPEVKFTLQHNTKNISFLDTMTFTPKPKASGSRIPFVNTYHPYSRRVEASLRRHWSILSKSYPNVPKFQQPFLSCYRRPPNIKDRLVRADIGSSTRVPRQVFLRTQKRGTFPCLNCLQCNNIQKGDKIFHPHTGRSIPVRGYFTCESTHVIYMIKCPCGLAYIGETTQAVNDRISQHKSNIRCNRDHLPLPHHFRTMGHNVAQLKFKVMEQIEQGRRGQNRVKLLKKREWDIILPSLSSKSWNKLNKAAGDRTG
ncbi:unnamed protein product [Ranitomeya imitator]|uniref:GIY-YIG domain-containing protein n=1 Tax=Ranitomeya imitator TaxID=111125 RepID=A0ABN9MSP4_9NEOB|nr:unnamed protein product [Ranitomeya imitator]